MPLRAVVGGSVAALVAVGRVEWSLATRGTAGWLNDFYDYWAAGALLNRGGNPYDIAALNAVQRAAGLHVEVGSGYSYPLFFAHLMRPFALMGAGKAAVVFSLISLLAFLYGIALLLSSIPRLTWIVAVLGGTAAGLFPPVIGSLYFGQANLIVLLLLALSYRCVMPGPILGIASAIKLYPVTGFLAVISQHPLPWRRIRYGFGLLVVLLLLQLPGNNAVYARTGYFLGPDTYWSNESLNGWLSRLGIDSTWTHAPIPRLPVEALMLVLAAILTVLTVAVLRRASPAPWEGALALSIWLGVVIAPKNSLWNFTPLLLSIVFIWTQLRGRWWIFAVGLLGWLLLELQAQLDSSRETIYQGSPALAWLSSVGLYGALVIGALTAYVLLSAQGVRQPLPRPSP